ncbi:MAG: DNA polymerase-3 subunit delta [Pelagibacterales bacterium]|nr:DNA polymerase-3 subunit delta [Pelagibacterales bacterium]
MIIKSFESNKINQKNIKNYLFYGENEGHKTESINNVFNTKSLENIYRYEEKEILDNPENFFNSLVSKSFFENEKLIIISRVGDKIFHIIEEIIEKNLEDVKIILNAGLLEKKSKVRNLFEKNKNTVCVAFYADNNQMLNTLVNNFFREKKISISQQLINLLVERCRGSRQNLKNELNKIDSFIIGKKNINLDQIIKLTNLAENYNVSELIDSCLAKNFKKTVNILNENNFSPEDCILIIRTLLNKSKRLHELLSEINNNKNLEQIISSFKPPIFWKDKEVVKQQMKNWDLNKAENLIYQTSELELTVKKNPSNAINILSDFIISKSNRANS